MSEKRTETYTYDESGQVTKRQVVTPSYVYTEWARPAWWGQPVTSLDDVRDVVDPYHG